MTIVTFEENFNIKGISKKISIFDFLDILKENGYLPVLKELDEKDYSQELIDGARECMKLKDEDFVNI